MIYFDHFDVLLNFGIKYVTDRVTVEDCIQDLFVELMKNREKLQLVKNVKFYLIKALRNKISNELRNRQKFHPVKNMQESVFQLSYSIEKKIIDHIDQEQDELRAKFIEMITNTLTSKQKEILYLKFNCGFNYEQIAEVMDIHIDSARTLVYRTFKQIKQTFGEDIPSEMILLHLFQIEKNSLPVN